MLEELLGAWREMGGRTTITSDCHDAAKLDCAFIATGHYARIEVDEGGVSHIITAVDAEADQSALLADLPQELLAKLVLPLGEFSKADAAEIAAAKAE